MMSATRSNNITPVKLDERRQKHKIKEETRFLSVPYHPSMVETVRHLLRKLKIRNIMIAPCASMKNRSHVWTNVKDKRKLSGTINASFDIKCKKCNYKWKCKTRNLDVERTALHHMRNEFSLPFKHMSENASHNLFVDLKSVKRFKTGRELRISN